MFINVLLGNIGRLRSDILNVETIELGNGLQRSRTWISLQVRRASNDKIGEGRARRGGESYIVGKDLAKRHDGASRLQWKGKESGEEEARGLCGV